MYFKLFNLTFLLLCGLLFAGNTSAHGNTEPQHGGLVKIIGEYTFELVRHDNLTEVYLSYEGEDLVASKISAMLKIDDGEAKQKLALQASLANRFFIEQGIADGSKVLVMVTLENGYSKIVAKYKL